MRRRPQTNCTDQMAFGGRTHHKTWKYFMDMDPPADGLIGVCRAGKQRKWVHKDDMDIKGSKWLFMKKHRHRLSDCIAVEL